MAATIAVQSGMALESVSFARNLSRLELAAAVVLVGVLAALFFQRMDTVAREAERTLLRARYQDMQSRLATYRAELMLARGAARPHLAELVRHLGRGDLLFAESAGLDWNSVPSGGWVYLADQRELHYRVSHGADFAGAFGEPARVRFQLVPLFADSDGNGRYDEPGDTLRGAELRPLDPAALAATPP